MHRIALSALITTTALSTPVAAATVQALFSDQTTDQVLYTSDLNGDGDVNDPGEVAVFFDANNASGLSSPSGNVFALVQGDAGEVYAADGASDTVYRLRDKNGNNTAQDAGEATVWFSAANADGQPLQTPQGVARGADGAIYIVQADTRGQPTRDVVYRTVDLNGDGDANDAGEASVWLDLTGLASGSSPFEISIENGVAYIADTAGGSPRLYRAEDTNGNGKIDADEVNQYVSSDARIFALSVVASGGDVFSYDFLTDRILRYRDLNGDKKIDIGTESSTAVDVSSLVDGAVFDFAVQGNEVLLTVNSFDDDDQLLRLTDLNGDGDYSDPGETNVLLQASVQGSYPQRPRSITFYRGTAPAPVPLPASVVLLATAFGGLLAQRRR